MFEPAHAVYQHADRDPGLDVGLKAQGVCLYSRLHYTLTAGRQSS